MKQPALLDHETLSVYQRALELLDSIDKILGELASFRSHLRDQLDRAITSVVLNIAEGAGEFRLAEKQRFYRMAKRSATEVAAVLDILVRRGVLDGERCTAARGLIVEVVAMLARMAS